MYNYVTIIGTWYPNIEVATVKNGDPTNYNDLVWVSGGTVSKTELEQTADNNTAPDERRVLVDVNGAPATSLLSWDGTRFVMRYAPVYIQASFAGSGKTQNRWLDHSLTHRSSNDNPFLVAMGGIIKRITYTNSETNTDIDLELWVSGSKVHTHAIRNTHRLVINTLPEINVVEGDTISIFFSKVNPSSSPREPEIIIYIEPTE